MIDYNNTTDEYLNDHVDNLVDILDRIPLNQVTILTGGNATGKSVIRKVMNARVADKLGIDGDKVVHKTAALSMQLRVSGSESLMGTGLDHISGGLPWMATSTHTWWLIDGLLKSHIDKKVDDDDDKRFIIIDELEIGLSDEVTAGVCLEINERLRNNMDNCLGVLVITHSKTVVKYLDHDNFINIEGLTEEEWLNREITPVKPEVLKKWGDELHSVIGKRTKRTK